MAAGLVLEIRFLSIFFPSYFSKQITVISFSKTNRDGEKFHFSFVGLFVFITGKRKWPPKGEDEEEEVEEEEEKKCKR